MIVVGFVVYFDGFFDVVVVVGYVVIGDCVVGVYCNVVVWFVGYVYGVGGVVFIVVGYVVVGDVC